MDRTDAEPRGAGEARLESFAARALDWPAVRRLLATHAPSPLGRRALEELAPRPDEEARAALARAREMQALLGRGDGPPLDGANDPVPPLREAELYRRTMEGEGLASVARTLRLVEDLAHWLAGRRAGAPACAALWSGLPDTSDLRQAIEAAIDRAGKVKDDASPRLARILAECERLAREVERALRDVAARPSVRSVLADGAGKLLVRRGRRVLPVKARLAGRVRGIVHDRSQSGETVFVEPQEVVEAANRLSALEADAERERSRVLAELTHAVLARRAEVLSLCEHVGELELAVLSARWAARVGGRPARLPGEDGAAGELSLRAFRHPLLVAEHEAGRLERLVPLDLRLGADFDLLLVTGPNTGGKTLALKSAGLAALMTRLGLALPCSEGTTVPLYDGVVADIGDEQEVQQSLSTFSSHLARIRAGLQRAGPRTLALLDELGGGTDPDEGAALGDALLEHLLVRGVPTLASTHLGKLKEFAFRHARAENAHVEFDLATLAPLYALVVGAPGESRALAIARRLGLSEDLVARAEERLERLEDEVQELMEEMRDVRVDAERLRSAAEDRLRDLETRTADLDREKDGIEHRRRQLESEAQRGLEERIARARTWVDRAEGLVEQLSVSQARRLREVVAGLHEALGDALLSERRQAFLDGVKKGDFVWLPRFKKRCRVVRLKKEQRKLDVRLGNHDLEVDFDDVTFYESL